ncbi:hypothetical protein MAR_034668 [Mya arenaria]|uniref:C2H2-type domain-containing protein n=1 Tax=Mya arenaria TaxID=6604 RepID=A0ABY7EHX2_MYAAR|nr:hypothetical protein MAR_034668 [Mya arenaria]
MADPNKENTELKNHVTREKTIKVVNVTEIHHSSKDIQTESIVEEPSLDDMDKGQACDDCGQLFDTTHDVQSHVKNSWCLEYGEFKKRKHEDMSDIEQDDSVEENEAHNIYNTIIDHGEESDETQELAEKRIKPYNEKVVFTKCTTFKDNYILPLRNSRLHTQIMAQIAKLIFKGHSTTSAVTNALRKHKNSFKDLFDTEFTDNEDSEEEESDGDVSGEETENEFKARKVQELMKKEEIQAFPTQNETSRRLHQRGHESRRGAIGFILCTQSKEQKTVTKLKPFKLKVGDYVSHLKTVLTRAYEVFRVHKHYNKGTLPIYRLRDLQNENIKGTFYQSELQRQNIIHTVHSKLRRY